MLNADSPPPNISIFFGSENRLTPRYAMLANPIARRNIPMYPTGRNAYPSRSPFFRRTSTV